MDTNYKRILKYLEPHGIGTSIQINKLLIEMFPLNDGDNELEFQEKSNLIKDLLLHMNSDQLIRSDQTNFLMLGGRGNDSRNWLNNIPIPFSITKAGLDLLHREKAAKMAEEVNESVIATNKAVQENSRSQKWTNRVSMVVSVISLFFIGLTTYQGCDKSTDKELQNLSKELQGIRQSYQQQIEAVRDTTPTIPSKTSSSEEKGTQTPPLVPTTTKK